MVTTALNILTEAAALVKGTAAEQTILADMEAIKLDIQAWPDSNEAYIELGNRINGWTRSAMYAIRGEPTPTPRPTSTPVVLSAINITKPLPVGNSERGEELLLLQGCAGCHFNENFSVAPPWKAEEYANNKGIGARAEERWQELDYTGNATNASEYLFESIALPSAYINEGYVDRIMPNTYGISLTDQEIADLIAYLLSIK